MRILAIETSCDETAIAIIKFKNSSAQILSNIISSQVKIHRKWGGVVPTLAKREHQKNLVPVLKKALQEAKLLQKAKGKRQKAKLSIVHTQQLKIKNLEKILERENHLYKELREFLINYKKPKIDYIAVTVGPGLEPALWVGINLARALAYFWRNKIVPINHIEAHILANLLDRLKGKHFRAQSLFPAICLIASGGHTQLIFMKNIGRYKLLGETRDDAAGECFDKIAKILGLGYPGGPIIAAKAAMKLKIRNKKLEIKLPRPMIYQKNYDFSFSGLKTAVLYKVNNIQLREKKRKGFIRAMSAEAQQAIIDVLIKKTLKAAKDYKVKTVLLGGGVAANKELRKQLARRIQKEMPKIKYLMPDIKFCTDNAAMIGFTSYFNLQKGRGWQDIEASANLKI